jgi:putative heme-binding domain-containing protein
VLETTEGRVFSGFVVEKTDQEVAIKDQQGQTHRFPASKIESLNAQAKSIMPDLVLRDVTAQDAADLLAYLTTLK